MPETLFEASEESDAGAAPPAEPSFSHSVVAQADESVVEELACLLRNRQLGFVVGAGLAEGGTTLGPAVSKLLLPGLVGTAAPPDEIDRLAARYPLSDIASAFREATEAIRVMEAIEQSFPADRRPTAAHNHLAYLADRRYIDRIYTTSYDELLETAISDRRAVAISDENYGLLSSPGFGTSFPVLHLHGLLHSRLLLASDDTYRLETPLGQIFCADLISRSFVFIGHSMDDSDLRSLRFASSSILESTRSRAKQEYVVHTTSSPYEHTLAASVWRAHDVRFIDASAEHFLTALRFRVERHREIDLAKAILRRTNGDPDDPTQLVALIDQARQVQVELAMGSLHDGLEMLALAHEVDDVPDL